MVSAMKKSLESVVDVVQCLLGVSHILLESLNVCIHGVVVLVHPLGKAAVVITLLVYHFVGKLNLHLDVG